MPRMDDALPPVSGTWREVLQGIDPVLAKQAEAEFSALAAHNAEQGDLIRRIRRRARAIARQDGQGATELLRDLLDPDADWSQW